MLSSHREMTLPGAGAFYASHELLHPRFRVRVISSRNVAADEILLFSPGDHGPERVGWSGPGERPRIAVLLDGVAEMRVRDRLHPLLPGDVLLNRRLADCCKRMSGPRATFLAVDWEVGSLGTRSPHDVSCGRLSPAERGQLLSLATALTRADLGPLAQAQTFAALLETLRAFGAPFDPPDARAWETDAPPPAAHRLLATLDLALSTLSQRPMTCDLEGALGVSRWHVQRHFAPMASRYALNGATWRTLRQRWRLGMAFFLGTSAAATTESIARAVGFGSPNALCRAFADARLPSPGEVKHLAWRG